MKYLGIKIDHLLKFDEHVAYIKNEIAKKVGYLKRISGSLSPWAREIVFNTTIDPHFKYCSSILLGLNHQDISALQKLQNKGMRAILHCHYLTHRADMLRELDWLSVHQSIIFKTIMFIYDVIHSEDEEMQKYIKKNCDIHSHYTRGQQKFHMPNQNNKTGQKSLFIKGLKIYNSVPEAIKSELTGLKKCV